MLKKSAVFFAVFIVFSGSGTFVFSYTPSRSILSDNIPKPVLKEPIAEKVYLPVEGELLFKWSPHEGNISQRKHYDFRLYEGVQMIESNLIFHSNVSPDRNYIALSTEIFKLEQAYTWSLRQVYRIGKSRRSSSSFIAMGK